MTTKKQHKQTTELQTSWRTVLARNPGVRFDAFPDPFLALPDAMEIFALAARAPSPGYRASFEPVAQVNSAGLPVTQWMTITVEGAFEEVTNAKLIANLDAYWRMVTEVHRGFHLLRPYYDAARGYPVRWKRSSMLQAPGTARVQPFDEALWYELGVKGLWQRGFCATITDYGNWDVALFLPRANVENFAEWLAGTGTKDEGAANTQPGRDSLSNAPRSRISAEAKNECFRGMRRKLKDNLIETQADLRKAIRQHFEGDDEADRPRTRTVQQWAKELWDEHEQRGRA